MNSFGSSNSYSGGYRQPEEGDLDKSSERRGYGGPRGAPRGGRRGGFSNGEVAEGERPRRVFERHSGTGRGLVFFIDSTNKFYVYNITILCI